MTNIDPKNNRNKIKIDNSEYYIDELPNEARELVTGIRVADTQLKMHEDTLKLISIGKGKMIEDLKKILENFKPIENNSK